MSGRTWRFKSSHPHCRSPLLERASVVLATERSPLVGSRPMIDFGGPSLRSGRGPDTGGQPRSEPRDPASRPRRAVGHPGLRSPQHGRWPAVQGRTTLTYLAALGPTTGGHLALAQTPEPGSAGAGGFEAPLPDRRTVRAGSRAVGGAPEQQDEYDSRFDVPGPVGRPRGVAKWASEKSGRSTVLAGPRHITAARRGVIDDAAGSRRRHPGGFWIWFTSVRDRVHVTSRPYERAVLASRRAPRSAVRTASRAAPPARASLRVFIR